MAFLVAGLNSNFLLINNFVVSEGTTRKSTSPVSLTSSIRMSKAGIAIIPEFRYLTSEDNWWFTFFVNNLLLFTSTAKQYLGLLV